MALAIIFGAAALLSGCTAPRIDAPTYTRNPALLDLPSGQWVKIHQQRTGDAVQFERQRHGGSAFDTRRGQLVLFGSDTHDFPADAWLNAPLVFDLKRLAWRQAYPADPVWSYRVTAEGLPVAGPEGAHPWAMHTFGAVTYDPSSDAIVVASYPAHLQPGRFTPVLAALWPQVVRHPTWLWHPESGRWEAVTGQAVHFFASATAYDDRRRVVVGYRDDGIYTLQTEAGRWRREAAGGLLGWGSNTVFDTENGVLIVYGSHRATNDVVVYDPTNGLQRRMPTLGPRPPGSNYVAMAFHPGLGRAVALIGNRSGTTEVWLYDYPDDTWTRLDSADLPFEIGMNYNLEYDPGHELLLLVATPPEEELPAIWALNLDDASH